MDNNCPKPIMELPPDITGGPAFPLNRCSWDGMSLRDYFAAKAMQGILSSERVPLPIYGKTGDSRGYQNISKISYEMADAMIAEREK